MDRLSKSHATLLGVAFGVLGPTHLLCPRAFEGITRLAFDGNIHGHIITNGIIETALGLAILRPRTRQAAYAATAVYGTYFIANVLHRLRARTTGRLT